jgi:pimeloyl-ACP methyl ester carboxylesterase
MIGILQHRNKVSIGRRRPATTPFRGPDGDVLPGSVAESGYRRIGGIDQWVMVRGERATNPPLILLHGGPGLSEMSFFRYFNAPLEKSFTVVNWDQRGAGKSYAPTTPRASMRVEQFVADLDEVVDSVRRELGAPKVALFGHSWGSALGVLYAARFPDKVSAYVGCGQMGDAQAGEQASYAFALGEAERRHHRRAMAALREIGPPPHTGEEVWIQRWWLSRITSQIPATMLVRMMFGVRESSLFELPRVYRAFRWSLDAMWPEVSHLNLIEQAPALAMPVFFFLGRRDWFVPTESSVAYFDKLSAPAKQLVWFEASGHEPFVDEADTFNRAMVELVRPAIA